MNTWEMMENRMVKRESTVENWDYKKVMWGYRMEMLDYIQVKMENSLVHSLVTLGNMTEKLGFMMEMLDCKTGK